jgi:hypothetical protein
MSMGIRRGSAIILIKDNATCIKLFTELGLMNAFQPEPDSSEVNEKFHIFEYDGCTCCGSYHYGHAEPSGNGYQICAVPITLMPRAEAVRYFADAIFANSETGRFQTFDIAPVKNS